MVVCLPMLLDLGLQKRLVRALPPEPTVLRLPSPTKGLAITEERKEVGPLAREELLRETFEVLEAAEVIVIGNGAAEFNSALGRLREDQSVIDFVRIASNGSDESQAEYDGICW